MNDPPGLADRRRKWRKRLVREERLELSRIAPLDPKSSAYASFATLARKSHILQGDEFNTALSRRQEEERPPGRCGTAFFEGRPFSPRPEMKGGRRPASACGGLVVRRRCAAGKAPRRTERSAETPQPSGRDGNGLPPFLRSKKRPWRMQGLHSMLRRAFPSAISSWERRA